VPDNQEQETNTAQPKKAAAASSAAPAYSQERLLEDAHAFTGYPSHVVAGALASQKKQSLTPDETTTLVEKWLQSEAN
jgi:hypothetical protein